MDYFIPIFLKENRKKIVLFFPILEYQTIFSLFFHLHLFQTIFCLFSPKKYMKKIGLFFPYFFILIFFRLFFPYFFTLIFFRLFFPYFFTLIFFRLLFTYLRVLFSSYFLHLNFLWQQICKLFFVYFLNLHIFIVYDWHPIQKARFSCHYLCCSFCDLLVVFSSGSHIE